MSPQEGAPSLEEAEPGTSTSTNDEDNFLLPAEYEARKQENILKNTAILEKILKADQNLVSHEKEGKGKVKAKVKGKGKGKKAAKDCEEDKVNEYELFSIPLFPNLIIHKGSHRGSTILIRRPRIPSAVTQLQLSPWMHRQEFLRAVTDWRKE